MSAIGNYIHYSGRGYLKHGITQNDSFKAWKSQKGAIKAKASNNKSSLTPTERKELEEVISAMMTMNPKNSKIASAQYGVENILNQQFQEKTRMVNWDTGGMEWRDNEKGNVLGKIHRHKNEQGKLELDLQKAKDKTEKLLDIMKKTIVKSPIAAKELHEDKRKVVQALRELERKMEMNVKSRGWKWEEPVGISDFQLMQNINRMIEKYAA